MATAVHALREGHPDGFLLTQRCQQGTGPLGGGAGWQQGTEGQAAATLSPAASAHPHQPGQDSMAAGP